MDFLSSISVIVNNSELSDAAKIEKIKAALAEAAVVPTTGIIERLVAGLKTKAGFAHVNPNLTSAKCPTAAEPSLDGARLEEGLVGSQISASAKLRSEGRRSATVAEGLLYGLTHPAELENGRIWCLAQVVVVGGYYFVLVLRVRSNGKLEAYLDRTGYLVGEKDRVLSFPMTEAEIAERDAEDAARNNA